MNLPRHLAGATKVTAACGPAKMVDQGRLWTNGVGKARRYFANGAWLDAGR
jgi:hypothetical protein